MGINDAVQSAAVHQEAPCCPRPTPPVPTPPSRSCPVLVLLVLLEKEACPSLGEQAVGGIMFTASCSTPLNFLWLWHRPAAGRSREEVDMCRGSPATQSHEAISPACGSDPRVYAETENRKLSLNVLVGYFKVIIRSPLSSVWP